jgi:hypothetical protein
VDEVITQRYVIDRALTNYLSAIDIASVYVASLFGHPLVVAASKNVNNSMASVRIYNPKATIAWIGWIKKFEDAEKIVADKKRILTAVRHDGLRRSRSLPDVIRSIEDIAHFQRIVITPHHMVVKRAQQIATHVDQVFVDLQRQKRLLEFNQAYRRYRMAMAMRGESVAPYEVIKGRLRKLVIRAVIEKGAQGKIDYPTVLSQFAESFPWFVTISRIPFLTNHKMQENPRTRDDAAKLCLPSSHTQFIMSGTRSIAGKKSQPCN